MSEIYFSSTDEANQDAIVRLLSQRWDCHIWRFPSIVSNIDYVAARDEAGKKYPQVMSFIEIKRNSGSVSKPRDYGQVWVDMTKAEAFQSAWKIFRVPSMYVVGFDDGLIYTKWAREDNPYTQQAVGRRDRGDPNDVRWACNVPFGDFKVMKYEGTIYTNRKSA